MKELEYPIRFYVKEHIIDVLDKSAELATNETGRKFTADDIVKAILLRIIGEYGEQIVY